MGTSVSVFLQTFSLLIGCVRVSVALCHGCVDPFENIVTIIISFCNRNILFRNNRIMGLDEFIFFFVYLIGPTNRLPHYMCM